MLGFMRNLAGVQAGILKDQAFLQRLPDSRQIALPMTIIPDLPALRIERVHVAEEITISLRAAAPTAACPACGTVSQRVQSRYTRRLHDLPASGRPVRLQLWVRRLLCAKRTCAQRIFAERFPAVCRPRAQRTSRLQADLSQRGLALGGQAGARLGCARGRSGSRDTILRLVRRHRLPDPPLARVVGRDDWAWTRRTRYGTLICDLERGRPSDLLPDRSTPTVAAWFAAQPEVEIVRRDGSSEYAAAIRRGAPHARQVSDRWQLTKKLAEAAYYLVVAFLRMVRERAGHQLDAWLKAVAVSQLEAVATCAAGLCRDKDAVLAGLTLPWSNGPLEAQVHRVTRSKRSRSGRAGFDLLRLRVLQRHPQQQEGVDPEQARGQRPAAERAPAGSGRAA
jgi:transposase